MRARHLARRVGARRAVSAGWGVRRVERVSRELRYDVQCEVYTGLDRQSHCHSGGEENCDMLSSVGKQGFRRVE